MEETIREVAKILTESKYVIALTGAGVSTESGIPDFRGPSGIWRRDPEAERKAYEVYETFLRDPREYWKRVARSSILREIERAEPNPSHYALAEMEKMGILKCIITQNVDNLHQKAGSRNVIDFHGNVFKLRCIKCGERYPRKDPIIDVPLCKRCHYPLKLDVVYFKEPIPRDVYLRSLEEVEMCDVMLVAGTSAVVYPAAKLPRIAKYNFATIIEINAEPTPLTEEGISDYFIQGKTGKILPKIVDEIKKRFSLQRWTC